VTQPLLNGAKVNSGPKAFRGERRCEFVELGKLFAARDAEERLWYEFSTGGCKPKLDFLDCLEAVAERAKLDAHG
jgi:hypothetical protein